MDRNKLIVGFLGIDKQEYMLYFSRLLYHLGKKVLLVDCSESGALSAAIPRPKGMSNARIEHRGIMFQDNREFGTTALDNCGKSESSLAIYDCMLVDYGFCTDATGLLSCGQLIYVTDQQAHNLNRLSGLNHLKNIKGSLIIKDFVRSQITLKYILGELAFSHIPLNQIYVVYQDELDAKCKITCQYEAITRFLRISPHLKSALIGIAAGMFPEVTNKELKEAYKKAERGA